ncbi:hypothetical protein Glove_26g229 [Diversispora epigaea]|uniref:Uncharacterized protein n=1 Tax=Diversispora epigaea TaxID=1348612 RepID=A0A397JMS5_9GLOM|nr:hypothetical protein Glove_26g229 [Diversispora epigaea]
MQTGWEESLPSITNENEEYEDQNMPPASHEYEDILENTDVVSNFSKNYDINQTSQSNFDQSDRFEESNMEDYYSFEQVSPDRFEESNIEDYDNFEQVSPEREENVMEFPNEAYADLMELFIKHNLNNKTGNAIIKFFDKHSNLSTSPHPKNIEAGRKLMDIMNVQKLPYSKHCILDYKNKEYFVYYRPIKSCIESLLSNPDIIKNFIYKYQFLQSDGETLYNATTTDSLGKSSLHPIYISLGNIRTWRRNKEDAKQLLGYLPILSANNEGQTSRFKRLARETFHNSLKFLLDPLFDEDGIDFKINNKNIWFFPRISTVIGDWPEAYATTTDSLGKSSLHPIYISLGNIRTWRRNKEDAKQLLGYLPILSANNEGQTSRFKRLARETFHNSLKFLLDPLFDEDGIDFKINNKNIWFFPRISTVIGDWPEACTFSLTFKSANSNYPCHFCQTHRNDLTSIRKDCIIIRNKENMQEYYNNGSAESIGLEQVYNYFWTIPNIDIYAVTVPDRMHHLDLGLFQYQIEYTKELLGKSLEDKMNRRIAIIPRHPGLKIFAKGVQSIARLTASEFRDLMKVMVFVVDNLLNKDLSEVYVRWNRMYLMSRFERFTESDLENFQIAINEWADLFITLFWDCSSGMKMPKLHSWIYHIVDAIRDFGTINGYTTEIYESLHKTYVKIPYHLSNKKDVEMQIMKNIRRRAMILRNQVKETKTPRALTYTAKLFIINFSNITELCNQQKNNLNINETMRKGFKEFQNCLYEYLSKLKKSFTKGNLIKIFDSVTLKNGAILRATNKFHGRPWFSNIAIGMNNEELSKYQSDKGICYAQTLLITEVNVPNESPFHLVLVQWYDYRFDQNSDLYDCPLLKLVEWYNFIEIEAIEDIVHMVPRFDKTNEYFVNKYLF